MNAFTYEDAARASGPWLLFEPDGTFDGFIWSPKTLEEAQRRLAHPRRWHTLEREGWTVRRGTTDELRELIADRTGATA